MNRRYAAVLCFANAAILGYAAHRVALSVGEADPRLLGPQLHTPFYWRAATALWWGSLAGVGGWRFPAVGDAAARALPWAVALAVALVFLVP